MLRAPFVLSAFVASSLALVACGARSPLIDDETSAPVTSTGGDASPGVDGGSPDTRCHCDDGIACTRDICDSNAVCTHQPDDDACESGDLCTASGCGPTLYVTVIQDAHPRLATLDVKRGTVALVGGPSSLDLRAIALASNGTLFALTTQGLAKVDRSTGAATIDRAIPIIADETGLTAGPGDVLFGLARQGIFKVPVTGLSLVGLGVLAGPDYGVGDLAFAGGTLLATTRIGDDDAATSELSQIDPTSGAFHEGGFIGFNCVNGLAVSHGVLYGVTCNGYVIVLEETSSGIASTQFHTGDVFDDAAGRVTR